MKTSTKKTAVVVKKAAPAKPYMPAKKAAKKGK